MAAATKQTSQFVVDLSGFTWSPFVSPIGNASGLIFKTQMTGPIPRRDALLRTAAVASAGMIAAAPLTAVAAPLDKPGAPTRRMDHKTAVRTGCPL